MPRWHSAAGSHARGATSRAYGSVTASAPGATTLRNPSIAHPHVTAHHERARHERDPQVRPDGGEVRVVTAGGGMTGGRVRSRAHLPSAGTPHDARPCTRR